MKTELSEARNSELVEIARRLKKKALSLCSRGGGHLASTFSCTELLTALYHGGILRVDPGNPLWADRDRFLLSKGHAASLLYAILADRGFFPAQELETYCCSGTKLGSHPDRSLPGVEIISGSLGHGLSIGAGMALAAKMDNKEYKTIVLCGDGECYEGSVWEAAMFASNHKLNNLVCIIDRNQLCVTDYTEDCVRLEPFPEKWQAFNWRAFSIDGHSFKEIFHVMNRIEDEPFDGPSVIIARTVKGKGVSFLESDPMCHTVVPKGIRIEQAERELDAC